MIAVALFMIIAGGLAILAVGSPLSVHEDQKRMQASHLLTESFEAVKSIRSNDWANITNGDHGLASGSGAWSFSGASDTYEGITRVINVANVQRDAFGDIVTSGGTNDPDSKEVTITISWSPFEDVDRTLELKTYIHNYANASDWP